jgi:hypothetical protein
MKYLNLLLTLLLITSCGGKNKSDDQIIDPQSKPRMIKMSASNLRLSSRAFMPGRLRTIYNTLRRDGQVAQSEVIKAQVYEEIAKYEYRTGQNLNDGGVYQNIMKVAGIIPKGMRLDGLKNAYLNILKAKNSKDIELNPNNNTLVDPIVEGRMNNISASKLFDFMLRAKNIAGENMVMIFQNGHVTPGFLLKPNPAQNRNAGYRPKWNLIGIEATSKGLGFLHFGDPDYFIGDLQIIDSDEFLMIELFHAHLNNPMRTVRQALRRTCRKYGLSCSNFPSLHRTTFSPAWNHRFGYFTFTFNVSVSSVFAFGSTSYRYGSTMTSFSHSVVSGARYVNNRYYIQGFYP